MSQYSASNWQRLCYKERPYNIFAKLYKIYNQMLRRIGYLQLSPVIQHLCFVLLLIVTYYLLMPRCWFGLLVRVARSYTCISAHQQHHLTYLKLPYNPYDFHIIGIRLILHSSVYYANDPNSTFYGNIF